MRDQILGVAILEEDGKRIAAKYGTQHPACDTVAKQKAYEQAFIKNMEKTLKTSMELTVFLESEWIIILGKYNDVYIMVLGANDENEIILQQFYDGLIGALERTCSKKMTVEDLWNQIDDVFVILDECLEESTIFETNEKVLYQRSLYGSAHETTTTKGITENDVFNQAVTNVKNTLLRNLGM